MANAHQIHQYIAGGRFVEAVALLLSHSIGTIHFEKVNKLALLAHQFEKESRGSRHVHQRKKERLIGDIQAVTKAIFGQSNKPLPISQVSWGRIEIGLKPTAPDLINTQPTELIAHLKARLFSVKGAYSVKPIRNEAGIMIIPVEASLQVIEEMRSLLSRQSIMGFRIEWLHTIFEKGYQVFSGIFCNFDL